MASSSAMTTLMVTPRRVAEGCATVAGPRASSSRQRAQLVEQAILRALQLGDRVDQVGARCLAIASAWPWAWRASMPACDVSATIARMGHVVGLVAQLGELLVGDAQLVAQRAQAGADLAQLALDRPSASRVQCKNAHAPHGRRCSATAPRPARTPLVRHRAHARTVAVRVPAVGPSHQTRGTRISSNNARVLDAWGIADGYWAIDGEWHAHVGRRPRAALRAAMGEPLPARPGVVRRRRDTAPSCSGRAG